MEFPRTAVTLGGPRKASTRPTGAVTRGGPRKASTHPTGEKQFKLKLAECRSQVLPIMALATNDGM